MPVRGDNSLYFSTALDNSGLQSGAMDAVGIVQGLARSIAGINPFLGLAIGAAGAFAAIANGAHKMMKEFETEMAAVKTIANVTDAEFAKLENRVFNLYKKLGTESPADLAKGLYDIIGSGYEAADALELLEIASKAATAGITTSAVAADGLTTILNSFRLEAKDAGEVADVMFAAVDRGKISFEELSSQIAQVAPLAASSGFSFQEIAGAIATLTKQGVPGAQAMTQIRSAIIATNEVMGDGVAKSLTLQNAFQAMYDKAGGSQNQLQELAGRIEAVNGILAIAGPNLEGATQDLEAMGKAAGSVNRAFETVTSTSTKELEIIGERVKATTKGIGESLIAISSGIARFINQAIDDTEDVTKAVRAQANEYNILKATLHDVNTPFDEKLQILKQLKEQYPEYLDSLELDKINNDNLEVTLRNVAGALKAINDEQDRRIKLSGIHQVQVDQEKTLSDYTEARERAKVQFYALVNELTELAAKNNIEVQYSLNDDIEDIYQEFFDKMYSKESFKVGQLLNLRKSISTFSGYIAQSNSALDETNQKLEAAKRQVYDNEGGYKEIVKQIQEINRLSELSKFGDYEFPKIREAFNAQRDLLTTFMTIDLAEKIESLEPFLKSENDKVREYAEKRQRILNTDYTPTGGGGGDTDKATFADMLKEREKQYKDYQAVIEQLGQEEADKQFQRLSEQGRSYGQYLQNLLDQTTDFAKRRDIALAAASSGNTLNRKAPTFETGMTMAGISNPAPTLAQDFTLSIDYIENKLKDLNDKFRNSNSEVAKEKLQEEIEFWTEKLELAEGGAQQEQDIYSNLRRGLADLNNAQLKDYITYWKKRLDAAKGNAEKEQEALDNIQSAQNQIASNTAETLREVSGALGDASNMFRKFGEDGLADALDKLSVMANGAATIAANITSSMTTGNWIGVASGVISMISGLFSGKEKGPSEYEKTIARLEGAIRRLGNEISHAFGQDLITLQEQQLTNYLQKLKTLEDELEYMTRLGNSSRVGDILDYMGLGGFDRVEELRNAISDLNSEYRDAVAALKEDLTGTTADSITQSIIDGFREGKNTIEDFADTFEDLMREALLKSFQTKYLEAEISKFYEQFSELSKDGLTSSEIADLESLYSSIIAGAEGSIAELNRILENAGFEGLGSDLATDSRQGLAGAITNITEDTANILEGYMNAIRLDVRQGLEVAIQNSQYLSQIANNTSFLISIDRVMQSMDGRFANIEGALLEFQAKG